MSWIPRIAMAAIVAFVVWIFCQLLGLLLPMMGFPLATALADFILRWALAFAVVAAIYVLLFGGAAWTLPPPPWRR